MKFIRLIPSVTAQRSMLHYSVSFIFVYATYVSLLSARQIKDNNPATDNKYQDSVIVNSGFESDAPTISPYGWTTTSADQNNSDASRTVEGGYSGKYALEHRKGTAYKVTTSQTMTGLSDGYYSLWAWVRNSGGQNFCFLAMQADGDIQRMTSLPVADTWAQVVVRGVTVKNGKCTISLSSDANAENWCQVDDLQLVRDSKPYTFLKGGDISELSYIESMGGKFFDNGKEKDCLQLLKDHGFNIVRLRFYNDPGNPNFSPSKRLPTGFQNPADVLAMSKRAKVMGFQIVLTFYYSDYWSNGKPHEWDSLSFNDLKTAVYNYTFNFMNQMQAQGTAPEFVSLGNEIAGGIILPSGPSNDFRSMSDLLKEGYKAVKAISPSTKIILHLDDGGNSDKYIWFFGQCREHGLQFDIIGASYYPFWTKKTISQIRAWANYVSAKFNKDIMIMETGYNWNPTILSGEIGQLNNNGPYDAVYQSSPAGQRDFLYKCFNGLKTVNNGSVIGDLYWDPVMIAVPGVGWELGGPNAVSNSTLFDFNGNALPALKAFRYNN
jgi:arabinogalactan endo-1,4-beta-galactosidase